MDGSWSRLLFIILVFQNFNRSLPEQLVPSESIRPALVEYRSSDHQLPTDLIQPVISLVVWLSLSTTFPALLNVISLLIVGFTILQMKEVKAMCEKITASAHLLSRAAIRVGVGPSTKKALIDYSKGKPEFTKLLKERTEQKDKL